MKRGLPCIDATTPYGSYGLLSPVARQVAVVLPMLLLAASLLAQPALPIVTVQPVSQTVVALANVTFSVVASGSEPLTYQWQKYGTNLTDDDRIFGTHTASLSLLNIQPADAGNYAVMVRNVFGSVSSSEAVLVVVTAAFVVGQAVDATNYDWRIGGAATWFRQPAITHDGVNAAQSGRIYHSQQSWIETTVTGPGILWFWWKVSCEGGYDFLRFMVDGIQRTEIDGEIAWRQANIYLPPGSHSIRWAYTKDGSESEGMDAGWVDQVSFDPGPALPREFVAWGDWQSWDTPLPPSLYQLTNGVALAAGDRHSLVLRNDGTLAAWGANGAGQGTVPPGLSNVIAIAAGGSHNLALKADGTVTAWGSNLYGETNVPAGLSNLVAIAAGGAHSLALRDNGTVVAWGSNSEGQNNVPAIADVVAIAAGESHSLALRQNGTVVAWGSRSWAAPVSPPIDLTNIVAIAAGSYQSLALKNDGSVFQWGEDFSGQIDIPTGLDNVVSIAAGKGHRLALRSDGTVVAWGRNWSGQTAVPAGLSGVRAIAAGPEYSLAIVGDGSPILSVQLAHRTIVEGDDFQFVAMAVGQSALSYQWQRDGTNLIGATGNRMPFVNAQQEDSGDYRVIVSNSLGAVTSRVARLTVLIHTIPVITTQPVSQTVNQWQNVSFSVVAAGYTLSYQWRKDGVNLPSGTNATYFLTVTHTNQAGGYTVKVSNRAGSVTSAPPAVLTVNAASAGSPGAVVAWGNNLYGQTTVPLTAQGGVRAIAAGFAHTVALRADGSVVAWGYDGYGQTTVPVAAQSEVAAIAAGYWHTVALKNDGSVVAWGENWYGQTMVPVAAQYGVIAIAAGFGHCLALKSDGGVVTWGGIGYGETAVPMAAQSGVAAIAAGYGHTVSLKSDGRVLAWGGNYHGQTTVPLAAQSGVVAIAAGAEHTVALRNDGSVVAWGRNDDGQTTVPVAAQSGVVAIAAGSGHSLALRNDGSLVAWGANWSDQTTVSEGLIGVAIAAGGHHSVALLRDSKPFITVQPFNRMVADGDNLQLAAMAVGPGELHFQWQRNGINLVGATNHILDFFNVQPDQAGDFRVIVANDLGAVTSRVARLEVLVRPRLLQPLPARLYVTNGATVTITAQATGSEPLQYQWRRNGENIPGATSPTLTITNTQLSDGGTYTLVVKNSIGVTVSSPMVLVVLIPATPAGDFFANRIVLTGTNGNAAGTNFLATREPGEPLHFGKTGSNSVWYSWRPPGNGIARFNTVGSVFDTLLAVYTGTELTNLVTIASDDDRGGYYTSEVRFNAQTNVDYQIALDGFAGNFGEFVLTWELEPTEETIPVITLQPVGRVVLLGSDVAFIAQANGSGLTYQWLFNGVPLASATSATHSLNNAQAADVGFYSVRVRNSFGRDVESLPAALQIASGPRPLSQDKLENLFSGDPEGHGFLPASLGTFLVSLGTINYQIVNNTRSATQQREPIHCSTIGNATEWLILQPAANGTIVIDTRGSTDTNGLPMPTILEVYIPGPTPFANLVQVACDEGVANGSRVRFSAVAGQDYLVMADGAGYTRGNIHLNWQFGIPPPAESNAFSHLPVLPGGSALLQAPTTNGIPPPHFQWFWNNLLLPGQTNVSLTLNQLQITNSGAYSVIVSNGLGQASHTTQIDVDTPPLLSIEPQLSQGRLRLHLPAVTNSAGNDGGSVPQSIGVMLEASSNLGNPASWRPVYLHTNQVLGMTWESPLTNRGEFFRARRWP